MTKDKLSDIKDKVPDNRKAIPDSNIGSKLLKKMGWEGGGVGKSGQGIAEPVNLESVIHREGLGLRDSTSKEFQETIEKLLHDYAVSNEEKDLVFSPTFNKDERIVIHNEAHKLRLKSKLKNATKGRNLTRYLVVSRKREGNQLFQRLWDEGGETCTHILIEAGQHEELA